MEKDINTEVSNTQLPATEEKANLKESLRIQKSQWIKEQIKRQREAEDAVLEQMIEEQRVIDGLNSDINENLDRTRESRKFNQEFQEKINTQIYERYARIQKRILSGMCIFPVSAVCCYDWNLWCASWF